MVKKIKVVEMNTSNPEAVVEEQGADPTPMQEDIPMQEDMPQPEAIEPVAIPVSALEEPKAKKPRQPRQPREPKPPKEQKLVREPRAKKVQEPPPSESDSIDTEEMVAVIKNHRASKKQPAPEPPPPPPSPPTAQAKPKEEEKATCPHCHKVMSAKSLKYAHAKNCRAQPPAKEDESRADFMLKAIEADKNRQIAEAVQHPISVLLAAERAMRMGQRRQRIESLLSNAF